MWSRCAWVRRIAATSSRRSRTVASASGVAAPGSIRSAVRRSAQTTTSVFWTNGPPVKVRISRSRYTVNELPQPQPPVACGFLKEKPEPISDVT